MKLMRVFTILFLVLTLVCVWVICSARANNLTPSPLPMFGAIFLPIMAMITRGAEIEEKEYEKRQRQS